MLNRILMGAALLSLAAGPLSAPAQAAGVDPALSTCATCHDLTPAKKKLVGPALFGTYGSKPVTAGIRFAKWDEKSLDTWLKEPAKVKPGTLMVFMVPDAAQRKAAIKALKALK